MLFPVGSPSCTVTFTRGKYMSFRIVNIMSINKTLKPRITLKTFCIIDEVHELLYISCSFWFVVCRLRHDYVQKERSGSDGAHNIVISHMAHLQDTPVKIICMNVLYHTTIFVKFMDIKVIRVYHSTFPRNIKVCLHRIQHNKQSKERSLCLSSYAIT